jgi:hypothetical protein
MLTQQLQEPITDSAQDNNKYTKMPIIIRYLQNNNINDNNNNNNNRVSLYVCDQETPKKGGQRSILDYK